MGCDRNLFTLRLVLNQTPGEWQWQAAAEGAGWGAGAAGKKEKKHQGSALSHRSGNIILTLTPLPLSTGQRVIFKAPSG